VDWETLKVSKIKWLDIIKDNHNRFQVKGSSNNIFSQLIILLSEMPMAKQAVLGLPPLA